MPRYCAVSVTRNTRPQSRQRRKSSCVWGADASTFLTRTHPTSRRDCSP